MSKASHRALIRAACFLILAGLGADRAVLPSAAMAQTNVPEAPEYRIGATDSLNIFVWDQPELSTVVAVRPDGKISTPLVEDLQAAGKTPTQLARDIEGVLGEFVRSPVVTVIVQTFVGDTGQQIRVIGEAAEPQALQYRQGMTVLDVMIAVGGLSEFAAGKRANIVRSRDGETVEIRVRLDDLLEKGRIEENIPVLPGDVLVIPRTRL